MSVYERLLAQINEMHVIDTHEHLSPFEGTYHREDVPPREVNTGCSADQHIFDENTNDCAYANDGKSEIKGNVAQV